MIIIFFINLFISVLSPLNANRSSMEFDLDIKHKRLKNGMQIINTSMDWGQSSVVAGIFIKHAGLIKMANQKGYPVLVEKYVSGKISELSKKRGYRFKSYLNWDGLYYLFYIPHEQLDNILNELWLLLFDKIEIDEGTFTGLQESVVYVERGPLNIPVIELMTSHRSVFSDGLIPKDQNYNLNDFQDFINCYLSPNNVTLVLTNTADSNKYVSNLSLFQSCISDLNYKIDNKVLFFVPKKEVRYIPNIEIEPHIKIGFPTVPVTDKDSVVYDLLARLLSSNKKLKEIDEGLEVTHNSFNSTGYMEIVLSSVDIPLTQIPDILIEQLQSVYNTSSLELSIARSDIIKEFNNSFLSKEHVVYLLGKSELTSGSYKTYLDYGDMVKSVSIEDLKRVTRMLNKENMYSILIKPGN